MSVFDGKSATLRTGQQGKPLAKMTRWYSATEVLETATDINAELLSVSGPRNPYPGRLGRIEPGAYADIPIFDGDSIADIQLVADTEKNFILIVEDGRI